MTFANDLFGALAPADDGSEVLARPPECGARAHPHPRRRHGHADPGRSASTRTHFRGDRFARLRLPPAGQQRPADPDPAGGDRGDPLSPMPWPAPTSSRPTPSPPPRSPRPTTAWRTLVYELNREGARLARARRASRRGRGRPAPLRRRRARADQPHRLDLARRQQSRLPRRHASTICASPMASSCAA